MPSSAVEGGRERAKNVVAFLVQEKRGRRKRRKSRRNEDKLIAVLNSLFLLHQSRSGEKGIHLAFLPPSSSSSSPPIVTGQPSIHDQEREEEEEEHVSSLLPPLPSLSSAAPKIER